MSARAYLSSFLVLLVATGSADQHSAEWVKPIVISDLILNIAIGDQPLYVFFRTTKCKHSAQKSVFHFSMPSLWMCVQGLGGCALKKEPSQQEMTLYFPSVGLQQEAAQMAQSEKSLAVASGARRPDGEGCEYGLSQNQKKNKKRKNDRIMWLPVVPFGYNGQWWHLARWRAESQSSWRCWSSSLLHRHRNVQVQSVETRVTAHTHSLRLRFLYSRGGVFLGWVGFIVILSHDGSQLLFSN